MNKAYFLSWMNSWLTKVNQLFKGTAGNAENVLFVDNPSGRFSFVKDTAIVGRNIATTPDGITQVRAAILGNSVQLGWGYVNQFNKTIDTYNQTTSQWESDSLSYDAIIKPGHYYYSPWNRTIWYTTSYGELKRLVTTTITLIG